MQLRERDWCNVITAHEGETAAYTWRLSHLSLGEHVLRPRRKRERGADAAPDAPVTAVAISCCGNFGLVGTAAGRVDRYNMQSGLHRGSYCRCAAAEPLCHCPLMIVRHPLQHLICNLDETPLLCFFTPAPPELWKKH